MNSAPADRERIRCEGGIRDTSNDDDLNDSVRPSGPSTIVALVEWSSDGVALTRHLKASRHLADIPIVMMTGDARRETLVNSMEAGAVGFVVKPVKAQALEDKLTTVLAR
ncbi:MAG: response regulator [Burkholderiaceae bacterium]